MTDTAVPPSDALTPAEQALVEAVLTGAEADAKRRHVRASVVRDLLTEARAGWKLPPAGLRLTRVIVAGTLDLEGASVTKPFIVRHSRFEGEGGLAIVLRDARLRRLGIHSCTLEGGINADRVEVESGLYIGGGALKGNLQIRGASISGACTLENNEIGDGAIAVSAAGIRISGPLILRKAKAAGVVRAPRANIEGGIYCEETSIAAEGIALDLESAGVGGDVLLGHAAISGAVRLEAARIAGRLAAQGLHISAKPAAILAKGISIGRGADLGNAKISGTVDVTAADVGTAFDAEGLEIDGGESAIAADVVRIGGNCNLARSRLVGEVSMPGAEIAGQLRLTEAKLYGVDVALRADGARIRGGCFMSRALAFGTLRFPAAEIGNQFRLSGASLKAEPGAALLMSGTRANRDVELGAGLNVVGAVVLDGADVRGMLDLSGCRLTSNAVARGGAAKPGADARDDRALSLVDARIGRLVMPSAEADRPRGIVDLSRLSAGSFEDYAIAWPPEPQKRVHAFDGRDLEHMILDGFTAEHFANPSGGGAARAGSVARARLKWLDGEAPGGAAVFKPQAWVALEQRLSAQGYHDDARALAIERRRRERRSPGVSLAERWQGRLLDWFALYGHNPWRTILWMAVFVLLFAGVWSWAASNCRQQDCLDETVLTVMNRDAYTPEQFASVYPPFNALAYSFDLFVPFVSFGYADHWRPNSNWQPFAELPLPARGPWRGVEATATSPAKPPSLTITMGAVLYVLSVVEQLIGLVLASLAVTGFTGLLMKGE